MNSTLTEVLDAARALPRAERAEIAHELIASLENTEYDEARYAELRAAVEKGIASLDAGRGIELSVDELDGYLAERSRLATERVAARVA
ncbi:hypothetical protein [Microbacterium aurum]